MVVSGSVEVSRPDAAPQASLEFRGGTGVVGGDWDAYRAFYSGGADVYLEGDRFSAEVSAVRLDRSILFDRRLAGVRHERTPNRVRADGFDHYVFHLNLGGRAAVDSGAGWSVLAPQEAVLLDTRRPMRLRLPNAHLLTASLARTLVIAAADGEPTHGGRIAAERTAALRALYAEKGLSAGPAVLLAVLETLGPEPSPSASARRARHKMLQAAVVRDWIDANLHRRDIRPEEVARACGLSRAGLYRLLAPRGGLFGEVRRQRLARLERCLAARDGRPLSALAEALGFSDASQLVRQFREATGMSPGRYRAGGAEARARWAAWMGELR